jgi:hypothetical protein
MANTGRMVRKALTPSTVEVGDFVAETLVTDTLVYEVVGVTAATIKVRKTSDGDKVTSKNVDGNPYPIVWTSQVPDPDAPVRTVRYRKDGTFRSHRSGNPYRYATVIDGAPVRYTDYRF